MDNRIFNVLLFFGFMSFLDMLTDSLCQHFCAKKCNYDCSKCSNWRCMSGYCEKKRGGK